jgi:hypothetical protein
MRGQQLLEHRRVDVFGSGIHKIGPGELDRQVEQQGVVPACQDQIERRRRSPSQLCQGNRQALGNG